MNDVPLCACPRPTQRIEESIDGLDALPQTPDVVAHREYLMRQLELAMAHRVDAAMRDTVPLLCLTCRGVVA